MGLMHKSRLSHFKQDRMIEHFVLGSTALTAARLCGGNRKTATYFFLRLREIIALELEAESEAMFGGKRKGMQGRGAAGKISVFGLLKPGGKVYTKIIPNISSATLMPIMDKSTIIQNHARPHSHGGKHAEYDNENSHCFNQSRQFPQNGNTEKCPNNRHQRYK